MVMPSRIRWCFEGKNKLSQANPACCDGRNAPFA